VRRRSATVATLATLALALPAPAFGQGAGDEQYRDPFAGQEPGGGQTQPQGGGSTGQGGSAGQGGSTGQPAADPATAAQTGDPAEATQAQAAPTGELPRTGSEGLFLLVAYGWVLLVGGAALRRIARARA